MRGALRRRGRGGGHGGAEDGAEWTDGRLGLETTVRDSTLVSLNESNRNAVWSVCLRREYTRVNERERGNEGECKREHALSERDVADLRREYTRVNEWLSARGRGEKGKGKRLMRVTTGIDARGGKGEMKGRRKRKRKEKNATR